MLYGQLLPVKQFDIASAQFAHMKNCPGSLYSIATRLPLYMDSSWSNASYLYEEDSLFKTQFLQL